MTSTRHNADLLFVAFATLIAQGPDALALAPSASHPRIDVVADGVTCPDERQVKAAVRRHAGAPPSPTEPLTLTVRPGSVGWVHLELVGKGGRVLLERDVASATTHEACDDLADTLALVVTRYLRDLDYVAPPRPPLDARPAVVAEAASDAPRVAAGLGYAVRSPVLRGSGATQGGALTVDVWVGHARRLQLVASVGLSADSVRAIAGSPGAELAVRSWPIQLGVGWAVPWGRRSIVTPVVAAQAELLTFDSTGVADANGGTRLQWGAAAGVAGMVSLGDRIALRGAVLTAYVPQPREFRVLGGEATVWRVDTPSWQLGATIGFVVTFGKNRSATSLQPLR